MKSKLELRRKAPPAPQQRWLVSPPAVIAGILSVLIAAVMLFRVGQRVLWLLRDFKPNGTVWEAVLLAIHESYILVSAVIAVLLAWFILRLLLGHDPGACHRLRALERILGWLQLLLAVLSLGLTGTLVYFSLHYRLSVQVIGWIGVLGAFVTIVFLVGWRFHRNIVRVLTETAILLRRGSFPYDEGIKSLLPLQCMVLTAVQLIPLVCALLQASLVNAAARLVTETIPILPRSALTSLLGTGLTGIGSMYAVETIQGVLQAGVYVLCIPVYHLYRGAHPWALDRKRLRKRLH